MKRVRKGRAAQGALLAIGASGFAVNCVVVALVAAPIAQADVVIATLVRVSVAAAALAPPTVLASLLALALVERRRVEPVAYRTYCWERVTDA